MGIEELGVNNIMSGIENTGGVKQHNHKKKLRQRFDIIKKLGQGTFGKVQLGINKETGQEVAIKTIKKSKIESDADLIRIRREIQIMSSVQHPNIIHIYEVFENREKMVLVMEYAAGGELYDYLSELKVLQEDEARRIFRQIATACYYCHKHKICHRDLKLENILLDENNNAKIADFGLSNVFDDQRLLSTFCGSPLYASPEIVKGTPYQGPEVDCWSLGVLLYTLVYGAMPFDGSNFKRLVKQISQGDYYEPAKPSPASPLIRDMLTVNPKKRASIEQICSHWWVNETYDVNCLDISEELANQTPVRLDVLLSLAPPAPQLESEKLVVTGDVTEDAAKIEAAGPTRSQSVGSLMELSNPERRILDLINEDKFTSKRKLESTLSTDRANLDKGRRDKIMKENTVADITVHGSIAEDPSVEDASMSEAPPLNKSSTQTISKEMEVESSQPTPAQPVKDFEPSVSGSSKNIKKEEPKASVSKPVVAKVKRTLSASVSGKILEGINEVPSQEHLPKALDKENQSQERSPEPEKAKKAAERSPVKKKIPKKSVLTDKNDIQKPTTAQEVPKETSDSSKEKLVKESTSEDNGTKPKEEKVLKNQESIESTGEADSSKPIQRRRSRIFEAAEKFQNLISPTETKSAPVEKPKKISIPGVSVGGFKKEFERKASLTSVSPPKQKGSPVKKTLIDKQKSEESEVTPEREASTKVINEEAKEEKKCAQKSPETETAPTPKQAEKTESELKKDKIKNAVSIISNALDKEGARKSKSRPCVTVKKPPMLFGVGGRSASGNIGTITPMMPLSPTIQNMGPKPFIRPCYDKKIATGEDKTVTSEVKQIKEESPVPPPNDEPQTSSVEITLKSATLPRRKTTKAQIQLNYPTPKPAQMEFKTEVAHKVEGPPQVRSEMVVPVSSPPGSAGIRSSSIDPEAKGSKERIIPISFEKTQNGKETGQSPPAKPPMPRPFQTQKSNTSQRTSSLSRQSTQESDSETQSVVGEPIKKSPREYIIPIAVEGGGYVTPRAGSLEPSDTASTTSTMTNRSKTKFGRARRLNSLLSERDSEDESPFSNLHRHSSFGKDSDTEDSSRKDLHMHRLRSSRPKKANLEHNDSVSSGEEDDDDGFEILTAENLFSTLLSRVRDLTSKLNVEDEVRPGFPSRRLLSHFDHGTNFFNRIDSPLNRHSSLSKSFGRPLHSTSTGSSFGVPWRRSVSRDLASDIESVFNDDNNSATVKVPRGDSTTNYKNLNLADLDLKRLNLSEEDALALSSLTPGLSKRIQQQLLAELTPSQVRKLQRTLSSRTSDEVQKEPKFAGRSADRQHSTLPNRSSLTRDVSEDPQELKLPTPMKNPSKSFLPVKFGSRNDDYHPSYDFNVRSCSTGAEPKGDCKFLYRRPRSARSGSAKDSKIGKTDLASPDSSISESLSSRNDETSASYSLSSRYSDSSASRPYSKYSSDSSFSRFNPSQFPALSTSDLTKTDKKPSRRRISRFLRPDFFDSPKEENVVEKEKKEREMETQKVLKEIRDKRKGRFRSASRDARADKKEAVISEHLILTKDSNKKDLALSTNSQPALNKIHDYVNTAPYVPETVSKLHDRVNRDPQPISKIHDYVNTAPYVPEPTTQTNDVKAVSNAANKIHDYVNTAPYVPEDEYKNTFPESTDKIHDNVNKAPEIINTASEYDYINTSPNTVGNCLHNFVNNPVQNQKESSNVLDSKTNKNLVNRTKALNNYVNVKMAETTAPTVRKESVSRIARPKSYPTEVLEQINKDNCDKTVCKPNEQIDKVNSDNKECQSIHNSQNYINDSSIPDNGIDNNLKTKTQSPEKETKISKIKKGFSRKEKPSKDDKNETNKTLNEEDKGHKNKLLQSIEKKLEKFRSNNIAAKDPEEAKALLEKKSMVENAINRLREQSVPPMTPCTESNLIKRAVSVEDMAVGTKPLQTSRKSVTKILGLFKKYEEQDKKKEKSVKKVKPKETKTSREKMGVKELSPESTCNSEISDKKERPKSLLYDKMKHFQVFNGARSDSTLNGGDKETKLKSKLPVTSFRRSLNLDNEKANPEMLDLNVTKKPDRSNLRLDLTKTANKNVDPISIVIDAVPGTSHDSFNNVKNENRNSLTITDDSSTIFSPTDDYLSCDSWSACSDYHHLSDLNSPVYSNTHNLYSGDESESVIDRIRRKSFYTRFNDKKRLTRKPSLQSYKDLDLYKPEYGSKSDNGKPDYCSLDRYRSPSVSRRSSYSAYKPEPATSTKEFKPYVRSVSALNDYVNVPGSYQTYNSSRIGRPSVSRTLYSDSDTSHLDDLLQRSRRHISSPVKHRQPSINRVGSVSPVGEKYFLNRPATSVVSPSTSEPI